MKIVEISHGNVEDENEGHFIHANNVTKAFSKYADIQVLEYSTDSKKNTVENISYIHLNVYPGGKRKNTKLSKFLSFDPFGLIIEQWRSIILLKKYKNDIKQADFILLQGCLLISAFIACRRINKKIVIDTHWINYDVAKQKQDISRIAYYLRLWIWRIIERYMFKRAWKILVLSDKDATSSKKNLRASDQQIIVIPQVIDFNRYSLTNQKKARDKNKGDVIVTFIGTLDSIQNRKALDYILSTLAPRMPECEFHIYGASRDSRQDNVRIFKTNPDIMGALVRSDILISPVDVGSGTKFKILDYLYAEKLIIATPSNFDGAPYALNLDGVIRTSLSKFELELRKAIKEENYKQTFPQHRETVLKYNSMEALEYILKKAFI